MVTFGTTLQPFVDKTFLILQPWIAYLQQFTIAPPPFQDIIPNTSNFSYTSAEPGTIFLSGGTVIDITLTRGTDNIIVAPDTTRPLLIPVAVADEISFFVVSSDYPTMKFIPAYGQNTTS